MMRQIQEPPPNLFRSGGPWRGFGSKDWAPTNFVQRVVGFMFGVTYVMGTVAAMASTFLIKAQLVADLHSEAAAVVFGFFLVCIVFMGGAIVIWLGIRLLRGAFRSG